jgi:hypothetical protein
MGSSGDPVPLSGSLRAPVALPRPPRAPASGREPGHEPRLVLTPSHASRTTATPDLPALGDPPWVGQTRAASRARGRPPTCSRLRGRRRVVRAPRSADPRRRTLPGQPSGSDRHGRCSVDRAWRPVAYLAGGPGIETRSRQDMAVAVSVWWLFSPRPVCSGRAPSRAAPSCATAWDGRRGWLLASRARLSSATEPTRSSSSRMGLTSLSGSTSSMASGSASPEGMCRAKPRSSTAKGAAYTSRWLPVREASASSCSTPTTTGTRAGPRWPASGSFTMASLSPTRRSSRPTSKTSRTARAAG